jgi:hypothetical protein
MLPVRLCSLKVSLSDSRRTWLKSPMHTHLWCICLPKFRRSCQMRCQCARFGWPYKKVTAKTSPCMFVISEWMKWLFWKMIKTSQAWVHPRANPPLRPTLGTSELPVNPQFDKILLPLPFVRQVSSTKKKSGFQNRAICLP